MESEIHSQLPDASPIVAYGQSNGPRLKPKLLALVAGSLAIGALLVGFLVLVTRPIDLPSDVPFILAVRGGTILPTSFPTEWRTAAATSKLPRVFELRVEGDHATPLVVSWQKNFFPLIAHLVTHRAYATLALTANDERELVSGPIDGNVWSTDARLPNVASMDLPNGDASVNLTALPDAWQPIKDAFARSGFNLDDLDITPSAMGWSVATSSHLNVEFRFSAQPTTSTILTIAAASGLYDSHPYTLPDGTVTTELRLPIENLSATGSPIRVEGNSVFIGENEPISHQSLCPSGHPIVHFSSAAMQNIQSSFPLLETIRLSQLELAESNGKLIVCF